MKNFRDYENLIRDTVKIIDSKDSNYNWSIHSFAKNKVTLNWSYLDKNDGRFYLTLSDPIDDSDGEMFITSRTPLGVMINGHICHEDHAKSWQESYENAIVASIYECFDCAHYRY